MPSLLGVRKHSLQLLAHIRGQVFLCTAGVQFEEYIHRRLHIRELLAYLTALPGLLLIPEAAVQLKKGLIGEMRNNDAASLAGLSFVFLLFFVFFQGLGCKFGQMELILQHLYDSLLILLSIFIIIEEKLGF